MWPGTQKKVRRCLKCGGEIEEGWLCFKCRKKNKLLHEDVTYIVRDPCKRYWLGYNP
jgi:hypothetical protein